MTVQEAAKRIGCSPQQVRTLVRQGSLKAKKVPMALVACGFIYALDLRSVNSYANKPQAKGFPRGQKRKEVVS